MSVISKIRKYINSVTDYEEPVLPIKTEEVPEEPVVEFIGNGEGIVNVHPAAVPQRLVDTVAYTGIPQTNPDIVNINAPATQFANPNPDNLVHINDGDGDYQINTNITWASQEQFNTLILNDQLRIQEDGKIIVSTELKDSMSELVKTFWKEVAKKFPIQSNAQAHIDHMKEGIKAAMDACESCDNGSCVACEILKTTMNDQVEPEIQEIQEGTVDTGGGDLTVQPSGMITVGTTTDDELTIDGTANTGVITTGGPHHDGLTLDLNDTKENDDE